MRHINKNFDFLDAFKMLLILMVLGIHAHLKSGIQFFGCDLLASIFRMAVPLFFLMSSYFFFRKIGGMSNDAERRGALVRFVKRIGSLYVFWFVVLLPVTIYVRWEWWFTNGPILGICTFLFNLLLGSTFCASWFLMALLIGVAGVFFLSHRISTKWLVIVGIVLYGISVCCSGWSGVWEEAAPWLRSHAAYRAVVLSVPTSVVSAFVWIVLGKLVSEERSCEMPPPVRILFVIGGAILYFAEVAITLRFAGGSGANDCYLMLIPICLLVFRCVKKVEVSIPHAKTFRSMSTVFYVLHFSAFVVVRFVFRRLGVSDPRQIRLFLTGCLICAAVYFCLSVLSRFKRLSWLKWSY